MIARLPVLCLITAVFVNLFLSANLLAAVGIPYATDGGNFIFKVHPGTYLLLLGAAILATRASPHALLTQARGPLVFLVILALVAMLTLGASGRVHVIILIETYLPAALAALIMLDASEAARRRLGWVVIAATLASVMLSMAELALHRHIVPILLDTGALKEAPGEFRGAGLADHPLTGAMLTMVGFFLIRDAAAPSWVKLPLAGAFLLGLLGFGGRTALAVTLVFLLVRQLADFARRVWLGRLRLGDLAIMFAILVLLPAAIAFVLGETAIGERILHKLYWDRSAEMRNTQWMVLDFLGPRQWLFGTGFESQVLIDYRVRLQAPFSVVENFWLCLLLDFGIVGLALFLLGFLPFLGWIAGRTNRAGRAMLLAVLLVASSSNSLGRKSPVLTVLATSCLAMPAMAAARPRRMIARAAPAPRLRVAAA